LEEALVVIKRVRETAAPAAGAVIEIVGTVGEDELLFFVLAPERPRHPVQSHENIRIRPQME
jgi:hypothetical protein